MPAFQDLTGQRFGKWTVLERAENKGRRVVWYCVCDCGTHQTVMAATLTRKSSVRCGKCPRFRTTALPYGLAARNNCEHNYKQSAKLRGLSYELSTDEFNRITAENCAYCGLSPSLVFKIRNNTGVFVYTGIDRIDNNQGYTSTNCIPCCELCNRTKREKSIEVFTDHVDHLVRHFLSLPHQHHNTITPERCAPYKYNYNPPGHIKRTCKVKHNGQKCLPPGRSSRNHCLRGYKAEAKKQGRTWMLTEEEFDTLTSADCIYCGRPPSSIRRTARPTGAFIYTGIDRIDNRKDYCLTNCVPCCGPCNFAKADKDIDQFMAWIERLATNQSWKKWLGNPAAPLTEKD